MPVIVNVVLWLLKFIFGIQNQLSAHMTYFVLLDLLLSFFTVSFGKEEEECAYDYFSKYLADCEGNNNSSLSMYV